MHSPAGSTLPLERLGLERRCSRYRVHDLLGGSSFLWQGARNFVRLDPAGRAGPHLRVRRPCARAGLRLLPVTTVRTVVHIARIAMTDRAARPNERQVESDPLWYKDAIIYQLHVKAFFDCNDDGIGDFPGLTQKLDYIQDLGVNAIWLLPFYPSPLRDDGYDIADYLDVHPDYGTLDDFRRFVARRTARAAGHHRARHQPHVRPASLVPGGARARRPARPSATTTSGATRDSKFAGTRIIFTDTETSNWAWDPVAKAYYWHRFFSPPARPEPRQPARASTAVIEVMRFWLDLGVDGLRLDAIPYLCEREGTNNENLPETHAVLQADARARRRDITSDRMLLAEANQWPEDVREYFGDGDECHMAYHFPLMPRIFMALAHGGPLPDRRDHAPDARHPGELPVGDLPAQPRRAHARDGHRSRARLHVPHVRGGSAHARQRRHPPPAGAADGERRRPHQADEQPAVVDARARRSSTTATRSAWATTSISATATACARRCSGASTATPASRAPIRSGSTCRLIMDPIYGYQAVNVEAQSATRLRC